MRARDIMTKEVISVSPETTVEEIARLLHEHRISGIPVVNEEKEVLGIVTDGDLIIRFARPQLPPHIEILGGIIYLKKPHDMDEELKKMTAVIAKDIMTENVITIDEDSEVEDIASLMVNRKVNRLPVVREDKLVGIVTRADIIETLVGKVPQDEHIPDVP